MLATHLSRGRLQDLTTVSLFFTEIRLTCALLTLSSTSLDLESQQRQQEALSAMEKLMVKILSPLITLGGSFLSDFA